MSFFQDLLKDFPALSVARERIALAEAKYAALEAENATLKQELARLAAELAAAQKLLPQNEFLEYRGILFKRKPGGGYQSEAYCPECRLVLSALEDFLPLSCSKCEFRAPLKGSELAKTVAELPS